MDAWVSCRNFSVENVYFLSLLRLSEPRHSSELISSQTSYQIQLLLPESSALACSVCSQLNLWYQTQAACKCHPVFTFQVSISLAICFKPTLPSPTSSLPSRRKWNPAQLWSSLQLLLLLQVLGSHHQLHADIQRVLLLTVLSKWETKAKQTPIISELPPTQ